MTARSARLRAALLLYAAVQFVVLSVIAMQVYGEPYRFFFHFLSELGATHTWSGRPNHVAMVLFSVALASLGLALIAFAGAWRAVAFQRERARAAGIASQWLGTLAGAAFVAVGCTPVDVVLHVHNTLVVVAFGLLLGYVVAMTVLWAYNDAPRAQLVASGLYLVLVLVYFAITFLAVQRGVGTVRGRELLVTSQKVFAGASMLYVAYLTLAVRRQLQTR